jgi:hypothetical protein
MIDRKRHNSRLISLSPALWKTLVTLLAFATIFAAGAINHANLRLRIDAGSGSPILHTWQRAAQLHG